MTMSSNDPDKRAQIGAHYTSREDILLIVEPVVMSPLRRQWAAVKAQVETLLAGRESPGKHRLLKARTTKTQKEIDAAIQVFLQHLATRRILDPACGSGNFLYVAIQQLLELEKEVITFAARPDIARPLFPQVRPTQLHGMELNPYAAELAQVVIWIGYLQWMRDNGFNAPSNPILEPLQSIECRDAILDLPATSRDLAAAGGAQTPSPNVLTTPALWPEADFIIGNPPFLGSKLFRQSGLTDDYISAMYAAYDLPKTSDLCCYWFEQARRVIEKHPATRAGLLATQGIRGGDNRTVLERIKKTGDIFMAWSDRDWILDGANVHVSMVGFDGGGEKTHTCDGARASSISANLAAGSDLTQARPLRENKNIAFIGACKKGKFELPWNLARTFLAVGGNPNGCSNSDVLVPWLNGIDVVQRYQGGWLINFGLKENLEAASQYEKPMEYVRHTVIVLVPERPDGMKMDVAARGDETGEKVRRAFAGYLHRQLEEYEGTNCDIETYAREIERFAD